MFVTIMPNMTNEILSELTEDNTIRRLKRISYEELRSRLSACYFIEGQGLLSIRWGRALRESNWTYNEYIDEFNRRRFVAVDGWHE